MVLATANRALARVHNHSWSARIAMFLSGAIYPLGFAPFEFWPIAIVAVLCLILALLRITILSAFQLAYCWGLGAFSIGASWVYVSIHEFGFVPVIGAAALTVIFVAFLALFKGFFGYLFFRLNWLTRGKVLIVVLPLCWLVSEALQSVVFNGFPWLLLGYSQIDSPFGGVATWLGVYGISWVLILLLSALAMWIISQRRQHLVLIASVICMLVLINVHNHLGLNNGTALSANSKTVKVALVQPNIAQDKKWDRKYFAQIIDVLFHETSTLWGADFIVWPEGAIPAYKHQVDDILFELTRLAKENQSNLILGVPEYQAETQQSYVALVGIGETEQSYHKQVLVPFGEYVPLEKWLRGLIKFFDLPMSGFTPATHAQQPMQYSSATIIPAICYEIAYPKIIRDLSVKADPNKPQIILTVSNDAWFGDSFGPYQHMQMARMRSLELGLPLIRSTNDGITAVVDIYGKVKKLLPRYQQDSLQYDLVLQNRMTVYRYVGWSGLLIIILVSLSIIAWTVLNKK
ncbi:apolipoprotein N-acyltransferase [Aliikangiella maris]|uniref:Apolipoprotein N-acyltransferase n=2 Tax=Aliikangiella maris TaxID=3162458 RepID=A0ABV2BRG2_9GAMM